MVPTDHVESLSVPTPICQTDFRSRKAKTSFILGLSSFLVSFVAGIPAIIYGLLSLREIRRSSGMLEGKRLAISGLLLGLVGSLISGVFLLYAATGIHESRRRLDLV